MHIIKNSKMTPSPRKPKKSGEEKLRLCMFCLCVHKGKRYIINIVLKPYVVISDTCTNIDTIVISIDSVSNKTIVVNNTKERRKRKKKTFVAE